MEQILQDHVPDSIKQDYADYLNQLQNVHALRDELGLNPSQYQTLLRQLTGSPSAKYMSVADRERVIAFMRLHHELSEVVERAQTALGKLNHSFALAEPELLMDKEVYLNGEFLTRTRASIEGVIMMMRGRYGEGARLICSTEEREVDDTSLKLEFVA